MFTLSKFKIAALTAGCLMAAGAQATGGSLGAVPPTASFSNTVAGAFTDVWTFSLPVASTVTTGAFNVSFEIASVSSGAINGFQAWLDGVELFGPTSSSLQPGGFTLTTQTKAGVGALAAGTHSVTVKGTGITGSVASYSGYVQAAPVPEPETYAMFAAGLGVVGFVAMRRRRRDH